MVQKMLNADYEGVELHHVRMAFSRGMDEIGKLGVQLIAHKLPELVRVIAKITYLRLSTGADVLWYPPAGPNLIPVLRDLIILISTRWLFEKTIFHFHAGGVSEMYERLPTAVQLFFRLAYFRPDIAVRNSKLAPDDGRLLEAGQEFIVPNGVEDAYALYKDGRVELPETEDRAVKVLFVGKLCRSKGVMTLLRACQQLAGDSEHPITVRLMGQFESKTFEEEARRYVQRHDLENHVSFLGVLSGRKKWDAFAASDIFCFPSYFESETFGLVVVEALCFGLPVVTTQWRGIPTVVGADGVCGFLVPPRDPEAVAERLSRLIGAPALRRAMGERGRQRYLENFTVEAFQQNMEKVFHAAADV